MEEIYICTQYLKGFSYSDVLALPVHERRYYLSLKARDNTKEREHHEAQTNKVNRNSKGTRQTRVSGENLKNRFNSGELPLS